MRWVGLGAVVGLVLGGAVQAAALKPLPATPAVVTPPAADFASPFGLPAKGAPARALTAASPLPDRGLLQAPQIENLERLQQRLQNTGGVSAAFDSDNGTPVLLRGKQLNTPPPATAGRALQRPAPLEQARRFLNENAALLKIAAPAEEFRLTRQVEGARGRTHLHFQQTLQGLPYWGRTVAVHVDEQRDVYAFQGRYAPSPAAPPAVNPRLDAAAAEAVVRPLFLPGVPVSFETELVFYGAAGATPLLTYKVAAGQGVDQRWLFFVDAQSGRIVHRIDNIHHQLVDALGEDLAGAQRAFKAWQDSGSYYAIDPSFSLPAVSADPLAEIQLSGDTYIFDALGGTGSTLDLSYSAQPDSGWDAAAVSAISNVYSVYNYFADTFGRAGIDDEHMNNIVVINYGEQFNNAFWNGVLMVYGNGDGGNHSSLAGCLDIAAHEMVHGIIQHSANLTYQLQSGALNESFADIFAAMVDRDDWLIGEDCTLAAPGYIRNLADPGAGLLPQPAHMDQYQNLPNTAEGDWGGVHINSGIPNRAAYLMAEGLTAEGLGSSIGRAKTETILYRVLTDYLVASAQFIDVRRAALLVAEEEYGADSAEVAAVAAAWDAVGVVEGGALPQRSAPTAAQPLSGQDVMVYLYPGDGLFDASHPELVEQLYLYVQRFSDPFTGYDAALDQRVVSQEVFSLYTRPAIVTRSNGTFIFYVGGDLDVYQVRPDTSEAPLRVTEGALIGSFAVSPDGDRMAYTSALPIPAVYVYDLENDQTVVYPVRPVTYQQGDFETANVAVYADSLSFDHTGTRIVFDALFCQSTAGSDCADGGGYRYWSVGILDRSNGGISYPFPNQSPAVNVGFPAFAANNSYVLVMDYLDSSSGTWVSDVKTFNLETQEFKLVARLGEGEHWGVPSFWGDDDFVTVQIPTDGGATSYRVPVDANWAGPMDERTVGPVDASWNGPVREDWAGAAGPVIERLNDYNAVMPVMHRLAVRGDTVALEVDTNVIDFGHLEPGEQATLPLTIRNNGTLDTAISGFTVSNSAFSHNAINTVLPRGERVTLTIGFSAGAVEGTQVGELSFLDGTGQPRAVSLLATVGTEVQRGQLLSDTAVVDFGEVQARAGKRVSFRLSNSGDETAVITAVELVGGARFSHDAVAATLEPGAGVTVNVDYSADAVAGTHAGALIFRYGVDDRLTVPLLGATVVPATDAGGDDEEEENVDIRVAARNPGGGGAVAYLLLLLLLDGGWRVCRRTR